jgi:hypothetical protein
MHQNEIKAAAGAARTGRKLTKPVYSYSLSWAPDETPSREEMIEAARESLRALGLHEHETLMVAHNDEPHPHIPETGKAAVLSNDHLILSRWAEAVEAPGTNPLRAAGREQCSTEERTVRQRPAQPARCLPSLAARPGPACLCRTAGHSQ